MSWGTRRDSHRVHAPQNALLNGRPLYLQLRDLMVSRIADQEWKVGQALPNEVVLSKEFNVSVGTVRKAMDELSTEGLIRRHQGRGTFIADRKTAAQHGLFDRLRTRDGAPIQWLKPDISVHEGRPDEKERSALSLVEAGATVLRFERVRSSRERKIGVERSTIPASPFAGSSDLLVQSEDIASLAQAFNVVLGKAEAKITMTGAAGTVADTLHVPEGTPLFFIERVVMDIHGTPVELCCSWFALRDEYYACTHSLQDGLGER